MSSTAIAPVVVLTRGADGAPTALFGAGGLVVVALAPLVVVEAVVLLLLVAPLIVVVALVLVLVLVLVLSLVAVLALVLLVVVVVVVAVVVTWATLSVCCACDAARYRPAPAWSASTMHVPGALKVTVALESEHAPPVLAPSMLNVTGLPEAPPVAPTG